jgi:hypothetical protein
MSWSMKKDRQLIKLATGKHSVEKLAQMLDASLPQIIKSARRLGVPLKPKPIMIDRRFKANPKD